MVGNARMSFFTIETNTQACIYTDTSRN